MNKEILKEQIKRHEGEVLEVYADSLGYLTLGVGHLIKEDDAEHGQPAGTPVSQEVVDAYYESDFDKHVEETIHVFEGKGGEDFYALPEEIQHVLVNMTFNLGGTRFAKFNNMWSAVVEGDWKRMAVEMEDSRWFKQVGRRSIELQESVLSV
jgi:GH24 family phage-related lysozyme (muramidase)|tara:strand:- start:1118 stop:1573 length:456 start_codon:yes stop_codon:yes gene_type:complete